MPAKPSFRTPGLDKRPIRRLVSSGASRPALMASPYAAPIRRVVPRSAALAFRLRAAASRRSHRSRPKKAASNAASVDLWAENQHLHALAGVQWT
jgi:hypothetical protein